MGGLGCPASLALLQAGVRRLTLVDPDGVELTNLHRQPWYRTADVGAPKVEAARRRILAAFPDAALTTLQARVTEHNAVELVSAHDVTLDGTDDIGAKFLLSDAGVLAGRPVIYAGVLRMEGQVMALCPGAACLRCLFERPGDEAVPTCAQAGVLGSVAGVIGALQAAAAIEVLEGRAPQGPSLLRIFDAERLTQRTIRVPKAPDCPACAPGRAPTLQSPEAPRC